MSQVSGAGLMLACCSWPLDTESKWLIEMAIQLIAAVGTVGAVWVALRLARRAELPRLSFRIFEVGWKGEGPKEVQFHLLNRGPQVVSASSLLLSAMGRTQVLCIVSGTRRLQFSEQYAYAVPWEDVLAAIAVLERERPWTWRIRRWFPRPVRFCCYLETGETVTAPAPASVIARLRGKPVTPKTSLGSAVDSP